MSELSVGQLKGLLANNNVITVPSGHTLYAPGSVVQVIQTVLSARQTLASPTVFTNITGLMANITPKFANSKIMVDVITHASVSGSTTITFRVTRNGTAIGVGDAGRGGQAGFRIENSNPAWADVAVYKFLDSPNSTAQQQYQVQVLPYADGRSVAINNSWSGGLVDDSNVISTITLMEIAQ